ncbi:MAG TPA: hypothetical protein VI548_14135 [Chitinophagaceae bacterium]|nr:hypothetical protein [Chitinophagaceae bacterium]
MKPFDRDLLVLLKTEFMTDHAIEHEFEKLHYLVRNFESPEVFVSCHELVDRNRVTHKESKLINVFYQQELKPFRFLICKN